MYSLREIGPGVLARGSTVITVESPCSCVRGYVPRTRFLHTFAAARVSLGIFPPFSRWIRGRVGRPSSKNKNTRRWRMENPTLVIAGKQPVHFMSFKTSTSSYGCKVYPIIPLFKKNGTLIRMRSVRISEQGIIQLRSMRIRVIGAGSDDVLIIVIMERFFVIPILEPPGVSFVQK